MSSLWPSLAPVAKLIPGVGLDLHAEPIPLPTTAAQHSALCSNGGDTTCRTYLSGMLSNANTDTTGYWVYKVQLPPNNQTTGASWWPAVWTFNNTPLTGNANEMDNEEQWPWTVIGTNVVQQTEQCYSPCTSGSIVGYRGTIATSETAMNTYGAFVTPSYNGFYVNGAPSSTQMHKNSTGPLGPIMTLQVNGAYGVTPAAGATADMIVAYYAHYKATPLTACTGGMATPAP